MPVDTDEAAHLLAEVTLGIGAARSTLPDTAEIRSLRSRLQREVAEIKAKGGTVAVPPEMP
jgi:hypothetical protein